MKKALNPKRANPGGSYCQGPLCPNRPTKAWGAFCSPECRNNAEGKDAALISQRIEEALTTIRRTHRYTLDVTEQRPYEERYPGADL